MGLDVNDSLPDAVEHRALALVALGAFQLGPDEQGQRGRGQSEYRGHGEGGCGSERLYYESEHERRGNRAYLEGGGVGGYGVHQVGSGKRYSR